MGRLTARVYDGQTGEVVAARAQVLSVEGRFLHPPDAILKVGPGEPFFYCDGEFVLEATRGSVDILVERGTEYVPARRKVDVSAHGTTAIDIVLERWSDLGERGWHPGNTHIHYDQHEERPDERLRLDPRVSDLRVTAISILKRWDRPYTTNKYPLGVLTEFCSAHHHVECGEESRHNDWDEAGQGYGHIMLLRLREMVDPVSRGYLVDDLDPDYPPLCYACDDAHRKGGIVIWCHNGIGMEAPVAAALGKLDAFNLFDPLWRTNPDYEVWYGMLNCGFHLPASTGTDWFVCSANRVYAYTGGPFAYDSWIDALRAGRTFITNGPAVSLTADDRSPGDTILSEPGKELTVAVSWQSHYAVGSVEVIWNGRAVAGVQPNGESSKGEFRTAIRVPSNGWIAARVSSAARDSYYEPIFAHTSPVYVVADRPAVETGVAAAAFDAQIEKGLGWVGQRGRFTGEAQRREVAELFRAGQAVYRRLTAQSAVQELPRATG